MNVADCYQILLYREELECDMPDDEVPFVAIPINRFHATWHVLRKVHLLPLSVCRHSF